MRVADGVAILVRCLSKRVHDLTDAPRHIRPAFDDATDIGAAVLIADQHVPARLAHWPVAGLLFVCVFALVPQVLKRPRVWRTVAVRTTFVPIAAVHFFRRDFDGKTEAPYADAGKREAIRTSASGRHAGDRGLYVLAIQVCLEAPSSLADAYAVACVLSFHCWTIGFRRWHKLRHVERRHACQ